MWFLPCPLFLEGQSIDGFDASVSFLPPLLWPEHHPFSSFSCRRRYLLPTVIVSYRIFVYIFVGLSFHSSLSLSYVLIIGVTLLTTLSISIVLCCIHNNRFFILSLALSRPSVACIVSWAIGPCRHIFVHLVLLSPSLLIVS